MSTFPMPLEHRFEQAMRQVGNALRALQTRTALLEPGCNVVAYTGTIPGTYTSGDPTVQLPGGTVLGPLPHLNSYTPHAGDVVLLIPVGQSYIIAGTYS